MSHIYHCPRCGNKDIVMYKETIECPRCALEFEIEDLENFDDEDVLAIEEKMGIMATFKDLEDFD